MTCCIKCNHIAILSYFILYYKELYKPGTWNMVRKLLLECLTLYLYLQANQRVHVGIIGAGIGGLAAAIAFRRAGVDVTVLEAADELLEVS